MNNDCASKLQINFYLNLKEVVQWTWFIKFLKVIVVLVVAVVVVVVVVAAAAAAACRSRYHKLPGTKEKYPFYSKFQMLALLFWNQYHLQNQFRKMYK